MSSRFTTAHIADWDDLIKEARRPPHQVRRVVLSLSGHATETAEPSIPPESRENRTTLRRFSELLVLVPTRSRGPFSLEEFNAVANG